MFRTSTTRARTLGMAAVLAVAVMFPAAAALARPPIGDDPPDPPSPPTTEPDTTVPPTTEPSPPPPAPGPSPTLPPVVIKSEPRFVVQAIRFDAVNETGLDSAGSDEVFGVWEADGNLAATHVFGNVDSGDTESFGVTERCITPILPLTVTGSANELSAEDGDEWRCGPDGRPGPIAFNARLFEDDSVAEFWEWACFRRGLGTPPISCTDDLIGDLHRSFTTAQLLTLLPQVGNTYEETVTFWGDLCWICSEVDRYDFTYRITRLNDQYPVFHI